MNMPQIGAPKFSSPEEEIAYLREKIREKELEQMEEHLRVGVEGTGTEREPGIREEIIRNQVREYKQFPREEVLEEGYRMEAPEVGEIVLNLSPETHDAQMEELLGILTERGIMNALSVVEEMQNPHLEDDFHRILVQYMKAVEKDNPDLKSSEWLFRALHMTLFEVTLPSAEKGDAGREREKTIAELLGAMEQFYAGMMSVDAETNKRAERNYFSIEIALPHVGNEVVFYVAVPDDKKGLFEKQVLGLFPNAKIAESSDDYNIFNVNGISAGAYGVSKKYPVLPIKTHEEFHEDPLNVILNVFSKLEKVGEGAAVQILISPVGDKYSNQYKNVLQNLQKGEKLSDALQSAEAFGSFLKEGKGLLTSMLKEGFGMSGTPEQKKHKEEETKQKNKEKYQKEMEEIEEKISSPILATNIRIVTSALNRARAEEILSELESAYNQFTHPGGNGIVFKKLEGAKLERLLYDFSFRLFSPDHTFPLNVRELSTICHFPTPKSSHPQLKEAQAGIAPAPLNIPPEGILLGRNLYRGAQTEVRFAKEDRVRHFYLLGQTGTGKTTLFKNMIIQDIKRGEGVCYIDPHGTDIQDILANIPPERADDVVYFDPGHTPRPMGLNMLEFDPDFPEQKTFVVNELLSIFNKLFDMKVAGGPAFEQYFRNASLLVMEDPASGNTLLEIGRVMGDKAFREMKLSKCKNPIIKQFWANAEKTTGEQSLANFVPYITNKFDVFVSNDIMRPIVAQEHSAFNFRDIMDSRKILLVNLSKGRLGDINSHLLGLVLVGKILMAALSRVDVLGKGTPPPDFYLYIDEFQNITTDSIATILSEARKYRLALNIAHQFIAQLEEKIRDSVFGNVGSMAVFRVGSEDAEFLEKQFQPVFSASDIIKVENRNAYVKLLINGQPSKPFSMETLAPEKGSREIAERVKELSYLKYGRAREEVEAEIMAKYN
ncbi:type IV secretion system DNA-binding domain-containing protein, partial [bacterium]|nr:type IV secretion system DNA-binding domain-containing protein [bacterium]